MINQLQLLDKADSIIVVEKGKLVAQGKFDELKNQGIDFSKYIVKDKEKEQANEKVKVSNVVGNQSDNSENQSSGSGHMMTEEELVESRVKISSYFRFIKDAFNPITFIVFLLLLLTSEALISFSGYWIGKVGAVDEFEGVSYWWRIGIYALLGVGVLVVQIIRALFGAFGDVRAMKMYHGELLESVYLYLCDHFFLGR
jgi:ABC-type multidrug transport system fused ATPase/permease subunit